MTTLTGVIDWQVFAPGGIVEAHAVITPPFTPDATPEVVKAKVGEYSDDRGVQLLPLEKQLDAMLKALDKAGFKLEYDPETLWVPSTLTPEQAAVYTTPVILNKEN
jgi:hypothetical protein